MANENNYKLIIWDFDGVIADSEKVWIENRRIFFNKEFNTDWSFDFVNQTFGGMGDSTKRKILDQMGYLTTDKFWQDLLEYDIQYMHKCGLEVIDGVEEVLSDDNFRHCIATGGVFSKTKLKIEITGIDKYIPLSHVFTIDLVERGKPEPDLFLLAAGIMSEDPESCLIIEDSLAGLTAAKKAEIDVLAFLGSEIYQNSDYEQQVRRLGVTKIFYSMKEIKEYLSQLNQN